RYKLTVLKAGVTDSNGNQLIADFSSNFHVLTGDANGDAVVNDADLYLVWHDLLKSPAARNLNEDLNGDGQVTTADLTVVENSYLATLPPPPALSPLPATLTEAETSSGSASASVAPTTSATRSLATLSRTARLESPTATAPVAMQTLEQTASQPAPADVPAAANTQPEAASPNAANAMETLPANNQPLIQSQTSPVRSSVVMAASSLRAAFLPVPRLSVENAESSDLLDQFITPRAEDDSSDDHSSPTRRRSNRVKLPPALPTPSNHRQHL